MSEIVAHLDLSSYNESFCDHAGLGNMARLFNRLVVCASLFGGLSGATGCGGLPEPSVVTASAPLNDTGVNACRGPATTAQTCPQATSIGQDAEQGRDAQARAGTLAKVGGGRAGFDFTKLGASGQVLSQQQQPWQATGSEGQGTRWHCVRDNHTGLTWEVKSSETSDLHYGSDLFSWYNTDSATNGGQAGGQDRGTCSHAPCDTQGFIQQVNTQKLCGLNNWRLPSPVELLSIVDQSQINPPVDTHYFPNLSFNAHWTNQSHARTLDAAWYVYFTAGDNGVIAKTSVANVLLVSGP